MIRNGIQFLRTQSPGVEAMAATSAQSFPRHSHDQFGIGVVDAGGHASASDKKQVEARPGEMILVNPGEIHDGRAVDDRGRSWRILYFDPEILAAAYRDITQNNDAEFMLCAPVISDSRLAGLFNRAFPLMTAQPAAGLAGMFEASLLDLVAGLGTRLGRHRTVSNSPPAALARACDLINDDLTADLTLDILSGVAGLSRFQLHRGFVRRFGLSPHAYILQRRVALARRLIRSGIPLAQAAAAAGFFDQSHFHRVFTQQFGLSPGQYAQMSV